jgi:predicted nucleic acid-binding protein
MIVIDASVGVKWFFNEAQSHDAISLLEKHSAAIFVPDLFTVEVLATLVREANIQKSRVPEIQEAIVELMRICTSGALIQMETPAIELTRAASLAMQLGHPLKDCIYLVLAMQLRCEFVTCDMKFEKRARSVWPDIRLLADFSQ